MLQLEPPHTDERLKKVVLHVKKLFNLRDWSLWLKAGGDVTKYAEMVWAGNSVMEPYVEIRVANRQFETQHLGVKRWGAALRWSQALATYTYDWKEEKISVPAIALLNVDFGGEKSKKKDSSSMEDALAKSGDE